MPETKTDVVFRKTITYKDDERQEFQLNRSTTLVLARAVLESWGGGEWRFYAYGYRKQSWNHEREAREYTYRSKYVSLPESLHPLFYALNEHGRG